MNLVVTSQYAVLATHDDVKNLVATCHACALLVAHVHNESGIVTRQCADLITLKQ